MPSVRTEDEIRAQVRSEAYTDAIAKVIGVILAPIVIAAVLVLYLPVFVYIAYVVTLYWGWFVVPTFGLSPLSLWPATGLVLFVRLLYVRSERRDLTPEEKRVKHGFIRHMLELVGGVSCFWLIGYAVFWLGSR